MYSLDCSHLDWKPVLLVKVIRQPFADTNTGLSVKRLYLAAHPDGILRADWTLPADERFLPLVQVIGWKPARNVTFDLPVQYLRGSDEQVASRIPSGTWVLPYDEEQYRLYETVCTTIHTILDRIEKAPTDPLTLRALARWVM